MTRSFSRFFLAEGLAALGIFFGVWLVQFAFQPAADTPVAALVILGGFDIFVCFGLLAALLRLRLQEGGRLPKSWIVGAVLVGSAFMGWTLAQFLDAERIRLQIILHEQTEQHLAQVEDALRQMQPLLPISGGPVDLNNWELVHNQYVRAYGQLYASLREKPDWQRQLAQSDEYVQKVKEYVSSANQDVFHLKETEARTNRDRAEQMAGKLRTEIADGLRGLDTLHAARWHAVGSMAMTDVFVLVGSVCFWLVLDRELRRRKKALSRMSGSEAHFRSLVEHQPEAVAVLDEKANLVYTNPVWQTAFNYKPEDLQGRNLFDLIHPADRAQVQLAYDKQDVAHPIACRLSADYGIWHDVEMQCQEHDANNATAVRFRNLRETAENSNGAQEPSILKLPDPLLAHDVPALVYTYDPATRHFLAVNNLPAQALGYTQSNSPPAPEFLMSLVHPDDDARVFRALNVHGDHEAPAPLEDEIRLRDAQGQYQSYAVYHRSLPTKVVGVAFPIQRYKHAEESRAEAQRHLQSVMESERQARAELNALAEQKKAHESALRDHANKHLEKTLRERDEHRTKLEGELREHHGHRTKLEGDVREHVGHRKRLEGEVNDHKEHRKRLEGEVNDHKEHRKRLEGELSEHKEHRKRLEGELSEHKEHRKKLQDELRQREERCRKLEDDLRDREERCRKMEEQMRDHDRHREELETTVRDHQDRLHDLHTSHERHADTLKASKEAMRRLASGVANDFNKILSVVLGYTDVLRESFPKDHMAQNYVDEMRQAASHGAELTQKLLAFSRNHLLQMTPVEMNHQLVALEPKIQDALGRDVKLEWDRTKDDLWVKTDPHPIEQALMHLLDHARQRLPRGATLAIRTRLVELTKKTLTHADMAPGRYVQIRLHDHTSDMDEATRQHLFEPYFSAKDGQKSDLGLATANGIIRQSGGCIDVESEPGEGSEIVINLPVTEERPQASAVA